MCQLICPAICHCRRNHEVVVQAPTKHCSPDPAPTSLVKRLLSLLADTIADMVNASFLKGVFPETLEYAIVWEYAIIWPRLKEQTLNPDDLNSYRLVSDLSFVSKIAERLVVARFTKHIESYLLLPSQPFHRDGCRCCARCHHTSGWLGRSLCTGATRFKLSVRYSWSWNVAGRVTRRFVVDGLTLTWFGSYLAYRTQTYHYDGCTQNSMLSTAVFLRVLSSAHKSYRLHRAAGRTHW
jgi:hypothetical protein